MKLISNTLLIALVAIFTSSCNNNTINNEENNAFKEEHSAFNSLDYDGTYSGILPCADCEGIKTTLTITKEFDYKLETKYLGKSDEIFTVKGTAQKLDGNTFQLNEVEGANQYFVSENYLVQLDLNGEKISGDLADLYILNKVLLPKSYQLTELNGKVVELEKPIFFIYNKEGKRINGFAGCNNFFGSYELFEDNKAKAGPMASTMMACADENVSKTEYEFLQMWEKVSSFNYTESSVLTLLDSEGNALAKFSVMD